MIHGPRLKSWAHRNGLGNELASKSFLITAKYAIPRLKKVKIFVVLCRLGFSSQPKPKLNVKASQGRLKASQGSQGPSVI